jgi:hypothetical protein
MEKPSGAFIIKGSAVMSKSILALLFGAIMVAGLSTASMVGHAQQTEKFTQAGSTEDQAEQADEAGDKDVAANPEGSREGDDVDTRENEGSEGDDVDTGKKTDN